MYRRKLTIHCKVVHASIPNKICGSIVPPILSASDPGPCSGPVIAARGWSRIPHSSACPVQNEIPRANLAVFSASNGTKLFLSTTLHRRTVILMTCAPSGRRLRKARDPMYHGGSRRQGCDINAKEDRNDFPLVSPWQLFTERAPCR